MTDDETEGEFSLVLPIVVVKSNGGPYDDAAYCAGWEMGQVQARLEAARHHDLGLPMMVVRVENVPQVDLLAMRVGASMTREEWADEVPPESADEWALVSFEWAEPQTAEDLLDEG